MIPPRLVQHLRTLHRDPGRVRFFAVGFVYPALFVRVYVYDHLKVMDQLLSALRTHKWEKTHLRTNVVPPEERVTKVYKSGNKMTVIKNGLYSQSLKSGPLYDLILSMAPERPPGDWRVTINRNVQCYPYKDRGNVGTSFILFLGDYEGGELCFEDGTVVSERENNGMRSTAVLFIGIIQSKARSIR